MWNSRAYWIDLTERVVTSGAGALLAFLGGDLADLWSVNWRAATGVAGAAALVSLCKALIAAKVGDSGTAALLPGRRGKHELKG